MVFLSWWSASAYLGTSHGQPSQSIDVTDIRFFCENFCLFSDLMATVGLNSALCNEMGVPMVWVGDVRAYYPE